MTHTLAAVTGIRNLIIVGAGALGREVLVWSQQAIAAGTPWKVKGFLDSRTDMLDGFACGAPIIGSPEAYLPLDDDIFLCAIGDPSQKRAYVTLLEDKGAEFGILVHPTALVGRDVKLGAGSIICPFTQMSCDIDVGRHVFIGTHSSVAHDTSIGSYTQICGACQLNGHVNVGEEVFIASSATLLPKCNVGDRAYVGAGSVVLRRVKARTKVFGNPAMVIGEMGNER
ncbi:acetyltransferase [Caballeronia sp. LP006]|uniref:acetyltransferase n=1 Tax=Caballeronia sp. LP006 TaxID=3038552 RepID=UPI00285BF43B|nr:acetyltransferase [Caballeronia sp. LP006]MDR5829796.1 acetyltransferase [Caballeronia sp. LP006]